jgi:hypothetical protein
MIVFSYINAVEQYGTLDWFVEVFNERDARRLAAAGWADEGNGLAGRNRERHSLGGHMWNGEKYRTHV